MTADILTLPVVRIERDDAAPRGLADHHHLVVKLKRHNHARLTHLAAKWRVPVEEAAAMMLSDLLDTR